MNALEVSLLKKSYEDLCAVDGISFCIQGASVTAVLGPNGAGKTTTINCICGLIPFDSGSIEFAGNDPKGYIGLCPQELIIWDDLTVIDQLLFMASLYMIPVTTARPRALQLLNDLGLRGKIKARAKQLSGGMKRRLNIALSLMHNPELLILDEPEAGLDPQSRILVRDFIKKESENRAVILTTHNMDEAERLADHIILIDHGRIIEEGSKQYLLEKYDCSNLEDVFISLTGTSLRDGGDA